MGLMYERDIGYPYAMILTERHMAVRNCLPDPNRARAEQPRSFQDPSTPVTA